MKIVEFFRGKGEKERNSSGANRDCLEFLRGYHIISKVLER